MKQPKTKRKAVRLYALMVGTGEGLQIIDWARSSGVLLAGPGAKVVELVERDRHAERVTKAAVERVRAEQATYGWVASPTESARLRRAGLALIAAVEAYEKARRK